MRDDRKTAFRLRKEGKSYQEIRKALGVPKSTLSGWLGPLDWSRRIQRALRVRAQKRATIRLRFLNNVRGENLERVYNEAEKEARQEFNELKYHPLFIAGIVAYWGEGDKVSRYSVRIANSDPAMIRLFVCFLRGVCQIPLERIKAWVLIYPDLDGDECKRFWAESSGLSSHNFTKCIAIKGRHKISRLRYGVCNVGVSSKYFKRKMLVWLKLLPAQLLKRSYYAGIV